MRIGNFFFPAVAPPGGGHHRPDIDGLRGVAILGVVLFHISPALLPNGFFGVDLFFVISGYLISELIFRQVAAQDFSLANFYMRRVLRLFPALIVVLSAALAAGWYCLYPNELRSFGGLLATSSTFTVNLQLAITDDYFRPSSYLVPLLHLWSLAVEEQFYLLWPPLLLCALRRRWPLLPLILLLAVASFAAHCVAAGGTEIHSYYLMPLRWWELAAGAILAHPATQVLQGKYLDSRGRNVLSVLGFSAFVLVVCHHQQDAAATPGAFALLPVLAATAMLAAGRQAWVNRWLLTHPLAANLGKISYPLYLWHWPLLCLATLFNYDAPPTLTTSVSLTVIALLLAWATYRFVETPLRYTRHRRAAVIGMTAAMGMLALLGIAVHGQYVHGRLFSPRIAAVDAARSDSHFPSRDWFTVRHGFRLNSMPGNAPGTVLFIGDSHIQEYWSRLVRLHQTPAQPIMSAIFVTEASCPPLPGINRYGLGQSCEHVFNYAMALAQQPQIKRVVLGAFWEVSLLNLKPDFGPKHSLYRIDDAQTTPLTVASPQMDAVFQELTRSLAQLRAQGKQVTILLSTPAGQALDPIHQLPDRITLQWPHANTAISRAAFAASIRPVSQRLRAVAAASGAQIIDPLDDLCNAGQCPSQMADGQPIYKDNNHLRFSYIADHVRYLDPLLRP